MFYKDAPDYKARGPVTELKFIRPRASDDPTRASVYVDKFIQFDGLHFQIDKQKNQLRIGRTQKNKNAYKGRAHAQNVQAATAVCHDHRLIPPGKTIHSPIMVPIVFIYARATSDQKKQIWEGEGVVDVFEHGPGLCVNTGRLEKNIPALILKNGDFIEVPGAWPINFFLKRQFNGHPDDLVGQARRKTTSKNGGARIVKDLHPAFDDIPLAAYEQDLPPNAFPAREISADKPPSRHFKR